MGSNIRGLIQGIQYGGDTEKLYFWLVADGADVTSVKTLTSPTVTIYDPDGDVALAAANLTQVGTTGCWYYTLNASGTTTWEIGYGYRAQIDWIDSSSIDHRQNEMLDVVAAPFNEPLISTAQFDTEHPSWQYARDSAWTDWTAAIKIAHESLFWDLRDMKDNSGSFVYPSRVVQRAHLRPVEMAYAERVAVSQGMRADEAMRKEYSAKAIAAFKRLSTMYLYSADDDELADDQGEMVISRQFER
jgi:hypothetical protein